MHRLALHQLSLRDVAPVDLPGIARGAGVDTVSVFVTPPSPDLDIFPRVLELLKEQGASDIKLIAGGIIPDEEIPKWKAAGVAGIFGPGSSTGEIVDFIHAQSGA